MTLKLYSVLKGTSLLAVLATATACYDRMVAPSWAQGLYSAAASAAAPVLISQDSTGSVELVGAALRIDENSGFTFDDTLRVTTAAGTTIKVERRAGLVAPYAQALRLMPNEPGALWLAWIVVENDGSLSLNNLDGRGKVNLTFRR